MKKLLALVLTLTMVLALCTFAPAAFAAKDDHYVFKLSHVFAPTEQLTVEMEKVAERIKERTNGAVEIQTYGSGQLAVRSEERRVGKECRSRWSPYH